MTSSPPSTLDSASGTPEVRPPIAPRLFDVCHAGVLLRALLAVHGVVALVLGWRVSGWEDWLQSLSLCLLVTLPTTLLWLLAACAAQHRLAAWSRAGYWAAALGGGAVAGGMAGWAWQLLGLGDLQRGLPGSAGLSWTTPGASLAWAALSGAALAAAMLHWLEQRHRLQAPVATAARLAELQARIRPHFLFNTLNSAVALVRVDPGTAEAVLEDLSELFHAALSESSASTSLATELLLAQRYLAIEQVRFGDRLRLHWQADPEADSAELPPLLLQPLVENAVRHGVEPSPEGGDIWLRTQRKGDRVRLLIENSLPAERHRATGSMGQGMALKNVRERLYLLHDVDLRFEAGPRRDGRWRVFIDIPWRATERPSQP